MEPIDEVRHPGGTLYVDHPGPGFTFEGGKISEDHHIEILGQPIGVGSHPTSAQHFHVQYLSPDGRTKVRWSEGAVTIIGDRPLTAEDCQDPACPFR